MSGTPQKRTSKSRLLGLCLRLCFRRCGSTFPFRTLDEAVMTNVCVVVSILRIGFVGNFLVNLGPKIRQEWDTCKALLTSNASSRSGAGPAAAIFFAVRPRSTALWNAIG